MDLTTTTLLPRSNSLRQVSRFVSSSSSSLTDQSHEPRHTQQPSPPESTLGILTDPITSKGELLQHQHSPPSLRHGSSSLNSHSSSSCYYYGGSGDGMSEYLSLSSSSCSSSSSSFSSDWLWRSSFPLSQAFGPTSSSSSIHHQLFPSSYQQQYVLPTTSIHLNPSLTNCNSIISNIVESFHYCIIIEFEFSYPQTCLSFDRNGTNSSSSNGGFSSWLLGLDTKEDSMIMPSSYLGVAPSFPSGVKSVCFHIVKCDATTTTNNSALRKATSEQHGDTTNEHGKSLNHHDGKSIKNHHMSSTSTAATNSNDHMNGISPHTRTSQKGLIINLEEYDPSSTEILQCEHYTPYPVHFVSNFCELLQLLDESIERESLTLLQQQPIQSEQLSSSSSADHILTPSKLHSCFLSPVHHCCFSTSTEQQQQNTNNINNQHYQSTLSYCSSVVNIPQLIQELAQRHCIHIDSLFERPFFTLIENNHLSYQTTTLSTAAVSKENHSIPSFFQGNFTMIKNCEKMAQTILKQVHQSEVDSSSCSSHSTTTPTTSTLEYPQQEAMFVSSGAASSLSSSSLENQTSTSHEHDKSSDMNGRVIALNHNGVVDASSALTSTTNSSTSSNSNNNSSNEQQQRPTTSFISKPLSIHSPSFEPPPHVLQQTIRQERALLQQVDSPLTDEFKTSVARLRGLPWTSTIRDIAEFFSEFKLAKRDPSLSNLEEQIQAATAEYSTMTYYPSHIESSMQPLEHSENSPNSSTSITMKRPNRSQKSNAHAGNNNGSTHSRGGNASAVSNTPSQTSPTTTNTSATLPSPPTYADVLKGISVPSSSATFSSNATSSSATHHSSSSPSTFSHSPTTSTTPQQQDSSPTSHSQQQPSILTIRNNEWTSMDSSSTAAVFDSSTTGQSTQVAVRQYTLPIELVKELDILLMLNYYGKSTGEAYVRFESDEELERARKTMDKKNLGNRYIEIFKSTVDEMEHSRKVLERNLKNLNNSKILKMRNVPFSATEEEIETFFSGLTIATAPLYRQSHHSHAGVPSGNHHHGKGTTSSLLMNGGEEPSTTTTNLNSATDESSSSSRSSQSGIGADESKSESPQEHRDHDEHTQEAARSLSQQSSMPTRRKIFFVINPITGKRTGEVFVEFISHEQMVQAAKRNKEKIRNRYIELFHSSISELRASQYYIQQHQQYYQTRPQQHPYLTSTNYYPRSSTMRNHYYPSHNYYQNRNSTNNGTMMMNGGQNIVSPSELKPTHSTSSTEASFIVKIEGLPTDFEEDQIADWLNGLNIADAGIHLIFGEDEHSTGEAFIEFVDEESLMRALERDQTTITSTEENHETGEQHNEITYTVRVLKSDRAEMLAVCGIEDETTENQEEQPQQEEEGANAPQETTTLHDVNTLETSNSGDASQQEAPQHQQPSRVGLQYSTHQHSTYRKNPYYHRRDNNYGSYNPAYAGGYYHPMMFMMQQAQYSFNNHNNYQVYGLDQLMNTNANGSSSNSTQPFKYKLFEHPERTLKMRGLPFTATEKEIMEFFNGYDFEEDSIRFKMDFKRNRQTGICYIRFRTKSEAERAANERNRCNIGDRYIELFTIVPKT